MHTVTNKTARILTLVNYAISSFQRSSTRVHVLLVGNRTNHHLLYVPRPHHSLNHCPPPPLLLSISKASCLEASLARASFSPSLTPSNQLTNRKNEFVCARMYPPPFPLLLDIITVPIGARLILHNIVCREETNTQNSQLHNHSSGSRVD
jgi:hypothetical protein